MSENDFLEKYNPISKNGKFIENNGMKESHESYVKAGTNKRMSKSIDQR